MNVTEIAQGIMVKADRKYLYASLGVIFVVLVVANMIGPDAAGNVSDFYTTALPLAVVVFSGLMLKKSGIRTGDGKLVTIFMVFATMRAIAEISWVFNDRVLHIDLFPSYADGLWFSSYGILFVFLLMYLRPIRKSIPRNIHILAIGLSTSFLIPAFVAAHFDSHENQTDVLISLAYPMADSVIMYQTILGLIFLYNGKKNEFLLFLLMAIIAITISDTFYVSIFDEYKSGNPIDMGWTAGYLLLAFAIFNFRSLSKEDSFQNFFHMEGKKITSPIQFETIVRFVIPFIVVVIATVSIMVVINDQYLNEKEASNTVNSYVTIGLLVSVSFIILFINNKLFYLVRIRTIEIETERDMLKLQIKERNEALAKSETLEKKLEETIQILSLSEQKYRNIYDYSNDLYCTIDTKGVITNCNESFAKNLTVTKKDLIGCQIFDHLGEKSVFDMNMMFATWVNTETTTDREIWLKRKNGSQFPTLLSMSNLRDTNGNLVGGNITMKDITVQNVISEQLSAALNELQNTGRLKNEFLAMVSHELKTPLVPIIGYCDILSTEKIGPLNDEQKKRIRILRDCSLKLRRLINDILDLQKIELGQLNLKKNSHSMKDIIRDTIEEFIPAFEEKHITVKLDEHGDVMCMCDKDRIQQVLSNLIRNSIDFCPENTGKIIIHLSSDEKNINITVEDNGHGIPGEKIGKLFVKFYQIDTSSTRSHGGTGLGLSICKGIIENHCGRIWAESELGSWTKIHLTIPIQ